MPGYPTKTIILAESDLPEPVVIRGYRCSDGRALRFYYNHNADSLPSPPYNETLLSELGDVAVTLMPMKSGAHKGGYLLFSGAGQWVIFFTDDAGVVGTLRIDAEPWCGQESCHS